MVNQSLQKHFIFIFIFALSSCSNTNSSGIGLTSAPPKPPTPPEVINQTAKLTETYKSELAIPEVGFAKVLEFTEKLELVSGDECHYIVQEKSILLEKEKTILVDFSYKQKPAEGNFSWCPPQIDKYVNFKKDLTFEKFAASKISMFMNLSNVDLILKRNPDLKAAEILTMESRKLAQLDGVFVRVKLVDQTGAGYLVESYFSSLNSFLNLIDYKLISMKTSEVLAYKKLVSP